MNSITTIDDLLKEKNLTSSEQEKYADLIRETRERKALLDSTLISGGAAAKGLSESLQELSCTLTASLRRWRRTTRPPPRDPAAPLLSPD